MVADADVTPLTSNTAPAITLRKRITPSPVTPAANFFAVPDRQKPTASQGKSKTLLTKKVGHSLR
jgi:hypothetical protein